nr:hypothetical protein Iba_chr11aCG13640 [Ipomoea batatas]
MHRKRCSIGDLEAHPGSGSNSAPSQNSNHHSQNPTREKKKESSLHCYSRNQHFISLADCPFQLDLRLFQLRHPLSQPRNLLSFLVDLLQQSPLFSLSGVPVGREDLHNPRIGFGVLFLPKNHLLQLKCELPIVGLER